MAISLSSIQTGIVHTLDALVGKNACVDRQMYTSPTIKSAKSGIRPSYPYVSVGKVAMPKYGISGKSAEYFNDDGFLTHETRYKAILTISVHGDDSHDAEAIAIEIRDLLFRGYGKELLHTNTNAGLLGISDIQLAYNYRNTDYEEVARMTINFSVTEIFIEDDVNCPSTGEITTITQTGELEHYEDDPTPLNINTTVP